MTTTRSSTDGDPGAMASSMHAYAGSRESVVLLNDSFFQVRQHVPSLAPAVVEALQTDMYAAPSTGGVDRDTEYAYCATAERCFVWLTTSACPTCYTFPVPPTNRPPHCLLLPRPLNASAEPALLLCTADGQLAFWNAVSDAFTTTSSVTGVRLPLHAGEDVSAAARIDGSQVIVGTTHARLFAVRVHMQRGEHHMAPALLSESRGLLARWFGGGSSAMRAEYAITSLAVGAPDDDMCCLVLAISTRTVQVWRVPLTAGAGAGAAPRLVHADTSVHRSLASQVLYARGQRFSAAEAMRMEMMDAAFVPGEDAFVVLYMDRSAPSMPSYGLALLDVASDAPLAPRRIWPLRFEAAEDPRPAARPRVLVAEAQPSVAFVSFAHAVVVQLLCDPCGSEESLRLRHGSDRILGACVRVSGQRAQWTALTSKSGTWHVELDVLHAQQQALDEQPASPHALDAQTRRLQERLESAVWFDDPAHPLQLDALPAHLDIEVLEHCVVRISTDVLTSSLRCMPPTVDLRTQLAQRIACALRLRDVLGHNGYLAQLSTRVRAHLRADAALLAGASDLWRLYDAGSHATVLAAAIERVLGPGSERAFFEQALPHVLEVLEALHAQLDASNAIVCTRLVLALLLGASRFRSEHGATYQLPPTPSTPTWVPWYASPVCIRLLEALFDATRSRLEHNDASVAELRTQLCALAEQALMAYEAREACTLDDAEAHAAAHAAFAHARPALLRPLLAIGRADRAFALAEHHRDFHTLVELCFADAHEEKEDAKRIKLMQAPPPAAVVRVEAYLDTYGMDFANELYQHYIRHGALRRLMEPQPQHAALVSAFLDAHPQYGRLAWVHDTALGAYDHARHTLRSTADAERLDVEAKQRMLSLGKLMHLATLPRMDDALAPAQQAALEAWDDALDLGHIQHRLHQRWSDAAWIDAQTPPEAQAEAIASAVAPLLSERPALRMLFVSLARDVMAGLVVGGEDMMDLLTLTDRAFAAPPEAPLTDLAIAAQVFVRLDTPTPARREAALASLWRRLFLMDDWEALSDTTSMTDDQVLHNVQGTVAFHTLQSVLADASTASTLMAPESVCALPPPSVSLLAERLQGLPDAHIEAIHAALQDEHEALVHIVRHTKLSAYFAHILSVRDDIVAEDEALMPGASDMVL